MRCWIQVPIVMALLLSACTASNQSPTASPPASTSIPSFKPTHTATQSPTPTDTPTPLPTLTPTGVLTFAPTPTLTPTPQGYFVHGLNAYTFIFPEGWNFNEGDDDEFTIINEAESLYFYGSSRVGDQSETDNEVIVGLLGEEFAALSTPVAPNEPITLKDGSAAERIVMKFKVRGKEHAFHLVRSQKRDRAYNFMILGPSPNIADNLADIDRFFESIELRPGMVEGLGRERTLVLRGSDPYLEDLDPARMDGSADSYIGHLFSGLVRLSPELQIEGDLAESWEVSADGTVYTFILRTDTAFQSGRPLTAQDVKYSWERAADPETDSSTAGTYLGDIVGVKAKLDGEAEEIEGVQVVDDRTLVVRLDGPKPYFLAKLTYPTSFIVDRENIQSDPEEWMFHPNASGPFGLKEFREKEAMIFERNNSYHTPPAIEYIVYQLNKSGSAISYFESGEIDQTGISRADAKTIMEDPENSLNDQLLSTTSMCTGFIMFNNTRAPTDDREFRRALALAVDRERLNEVLYDNQSMLARSILPPAMPGYLVDREVLSFDPEGARAALEASGYGAESPKIVINRAGYASSDSAYMDALIETWRETLGLEFVIDYVDPRNSVEGYREADGHIAVNGWCADYPDPENFLDILFHSDSVFNSANYKNPEVDVLLEAARVEFDPILRMELYQEIETILLEDISVTPMWHHIWFELVNPRIQGYVLTPVGVPIVHLLSIVDEDQ